MVLNRVLPAIENRTCQPTAISFLHLVGRFQYLYGVWDYACQLTGAIPPEWSIGLSTVDEHLYILQASFSVRAINVADNQPDRP